MVMEPSRRYTIYVVCKFHRLAAGALCGKDPDQIRDKFRGSHNPAGTMAVLRLVLAMAFPSHAWALIDVIMEPASRFLPAGQ